MWRPFVFQILLFLLPFFLYALWLFIRRGVDPTRKDAWRDAPFIALVVAAVVATGLGLFLVGHFTSAPAGSRYVPAQLDENGNLIGPTLQ